MLILVLKIIGRLPIFRNQVDVTMISKELDVQIYIVLTIDANLAMQNQLALICY